MDGQYFKNLADSMSNKRIQWVIEHNGYDEVLDTAEVQFFLTCKYILISYVCVSIFEL